MRRSQSALVSVVALLLGLTSAGTAHAAEEPWVELTSAAFTNVLTATPGPLAGHRGNWHSLSVDVDGDDDGVTGGLVDWRCAPGQPFDGTCTRLAEWEFTDDGTVSVTWSARLGEMRIAGTVTLENVATGATSTATLLLYLHAKGALIRTVTEETLPDAQDTYDIRVVDFTRDDVVVRGRLGWLSTAGASVVQVRPLHVVRTDVRGYDA